MTDSTLIIKKIRTVIVDGERLEREALIHAIGEYCPEIEIVAECGSASEAFKAIMETYPQLVFLDVEIPKSNGFELLRMFNPVNFKFIFVTTLSQYATDAFRVHAVDYLLKPLRNFELIESVNKVKNELKIAGSISQLEKLVEGFTGNIRQNSNLVLIDTNGFSVVRTGEVIMCKAETYCTSVFLVNHIIENSAKNLKYYEDILDPHQFMRVHHSYIINLDHVKRYNNKDEIILTDNLTCCLSRAHKHGFQEYYRNRAFIKVG